MAKKYYWLKLKRDPTIGEKPWKNAEGYRNQTAYEAIIHCKTNGKTERVQEGRKE